MTGAGAAVMVLPLAFATQLATATVLRIATERPYRQVEALRLQDYPVTLGGGNARLTVSHEYGTYIEDARAAAGKAKFIPGTPMIDLSGVSPGILYVLGATSAGQAWSLGGYPWSDKLAIEMRRSVDCQVLAASWLLAEPNGQFKLSPRVLSSFGADLTSDYEEAGTFMAPIGASGFTQLRRQHLLRPARPLDVAIKACQSTRK